MLRYITLTCHLRGGFATYVDYDLQQANYVTNVNLLALSILNIELKSKKII